MARISGVDIPNDKRIEVGLTYIFGIGLTRSQEILASAGISVDTRAKDLTDDEVIKIRDYIDKHFIVEGDLRREVRQNITRLIEVKCDPPKPRSRELPVTGP